MLDTTYDYPDDRWYEARRDYLAGLTGMAVCQKYNVSMSSFREHARKGGWRRMDRPDCGVAPEPEEYHLDDDVTLADLAHQALLNIRRAIGTGRASEANGWMRLYDKLADRARPQVMTHLPNIPLPPEPEAGESTLFLTTEDAGAKELDSLDSVFPESISAEAADPMDSLDSVFAESVSAETLDAADVNPAWTDDRLDSVDSVFPESEPLVAVDPDPFDRDATLLTRRRRMFHGLSHRDLDARLIAHGVNPEAQDFFDPDDLRT